MDVVQHGLDSVWAAVLRHEAVFQHPLFDATYGLSIYMVLALPLVILELYRPTWFVSRKVQPNVHVTWTDIRKCSINLIRNQLLLVFPLSALRYLEEPVPFVLDAPQLSTLAIDLVKCFFLFDFFFYLSHYLLHTRFFYKHVHFLHHQYHAPYALVTQYLHPVELLFMGLSGASCPFIFRCHRMTHWIWMTLVTITSVEHHCGLELPFDLHSWTFGLYAGSRWHDMHHQRPLTNYCAMFSIWDRVFGSAFPTSNGEKELKSK